MTGKRSRWTRLLHLGIGCVMLCQLAWQARPVFAAAETTSFTFADLGEKDIRVKTIYDEDRVDFPLPDGRVVDRAALRLHLAHSPDLLPELSSLAIAINDEPVAHLTLGPDNAADTVLEILLPPDGLHPGNNSLKMYFTLRLQTSGCGDVDAQGLWANVFADSTIQLEGHDVPLPADLSRYPALFTALSTLPGSPGLTLVLPPNPTPEELSAAAQISAALGQAAGWRQPPLWAISAASAADPAATTRLASDHLIVIDVAGRNANLTENTAAAPGVTALASPYNRARLMLVVSAVDQATLSQSVALLTTQSARPLLKGTNAAPQPLRPLPVLAQPARATFASLGLKTQRVNGIGNHHLYYPLDVPYDWKTTSDAALELHFKHASGLSSSADLSAYINGFKITNVALDNRNAADGRLVIRLSPRQIHPGRNWLHLAFDLHLKGEDCNYRYLQEAWAELSAEDSIANLAHVSSTAPLELRYLPAPLVTAEDLSADLFVLPPQPSDADLTALVRLNAKLGTYAAQSSASVDGLRPRAITAGDFDTLLNSNRLHNLQVIAIGSAAENAVLQQYDAWLPQPLHTVDGVIEPAGGRALFPEETAGQAGYIQLAAAPWDRQQAWIVISAPAGQLLKVVEAMPTLKQRLKLPGNVAVVTNNSIYGLNLGELAGTPLSAPARLVIAGILIGAFVFSGGIGWIIGRRKRQKEQEAKDADE